MSWIKRHYGKKFSLSLHCQKGVAERGVVGPQNVLYWKHSSHTLAESAWQKYEKEIKDIFMQHSQRELTSHLKVLYWRGLSVILHKDIFLCVTGRLAAFGMKDKNWIETERTPLINNLNKSQNKWGNLLWLNLSKRIFLVVWNVYCCTHVLTFTNACIAAGEPIPLLSVSVQPDTENHEDDPTSSSYSCYKGRLLYHIWDLLGEGVLRGLRPWYSPRCIWIE